MSNGSQMPTAELGLGYPESDDKLKALGSSGEEKGGKESTF